MPSEFYLSSGNMAKPWQPKSSLEPIVISDPHFYDFFPSIHLIVVLPGFFYKDIYSDHKGSQ